MLSERGVLVAGAGVAGRGVLTMLRQMGAANIIVADDHVTQSELAVRDSPEFAKETYLKVAEARELIGGESAPQLVITSPGWRPDSPLLAEAQAEGIPVIGDIEAAWLADQAESFGPARTWLAITGTNGKTTTTAMLTAMLIADGQAAAAVGNIGTAPGIALTAEARGEQRVDVMVAEVSSFQLHWAPSFRPDTGCVLNLAEDHLDWHGSYASYADAKAQVFRARTAVIPANEPEVLETIARLWPDASQIPCEDIRLFSSGESVELGSVQSALDGRVSRSDVCIRGGKVVELAGQDVVLASAEGISPPGPAGLADAAAAAAMARSVGVKPESIASALENFRVQAHRGQVVANTGGAQWIDNSKATNPHAAAAALKGQSNVVWIAGGQLKGAAIEPLIQEVAEALKAVVVLGADRAIIAEAMEKLAPHVPVDVVEETDPEAAMKAVVARAKERLSPGDSVILAPAAASLDMYTGMSQRGDLFAEYAMEGSQS
ncbi:UDP-N-acetylmuramoyl-L-alanine--D-glutamate ligase [uncultured Corynebacterium sp.]|uniref:UDP-N-acetylmuramoyl-L-alanine--D-glutamate ligase n=1 Tax=uncultured Corynebacterium sp. TaxID=159447 RepID=UPI002597E440|nr:UDP-N-acetylmuramoyl-L-alanine--D-glutamate ligase [uncultured Corynebacterium sp.]